MTFPLEPAFWNWYLLGLVLVAIELVIPGAYLLWFGVGALACGVVVHIVGDFYWPAQIYLFCLFSACSVFLGRRYIYKAKPSTTTTLNRRLHQYIGRRGELTSPIVNGKGRIRLDDTSWIVYGPDLPAGRTVIVTGVDNATLVVADGDPPPPSPQPPPSA